MAIARVALVSRLRTFSTGWACAIPVGVQDGDVAFTFFQHTNSNPITPPAGQGYALLDPVDVAGGLTAYLHCFGAVLQAADGGTNHTFTWSSATIPSACLILRGVDPAQPLDVADPPAATTTDATTVASPASTVATAGAWVLWPTATAAVVTHSFPATVDGNAVTREVGATAGTQGLAWAAYPAAGPVSAATVTFSASGRTLGKTLVVKPLVVGAALRRRDAGGAWAPATAQRWTGSAWVPATVKRWDGTGWV